MRNPGLAWIQGQGWDQNKFPGKTFLTNAIESIVSFDAGGAYEGGWAIAVLANAKALELAGVRPGQQIDGGTIETKDGRLTGILIDNAERLVFRQVPELSSAESLASALIPLSTGVLPRG